jgi:tetratricopeptide (TPR) repeat protein
MRLREIVVAAVLSALLSTSAMAAGGSRQQQPPDPVMQGTETPRSPEEQAELFYHQGLKARDKAWKLDKKAAGATKAKKREKYQRKALKQFDKAIDSFSEAIRLNPDFYQAYSSLGYALRRSGRFEEALAAYDRALEQNGAYTEAIEYRAEAYLGLDRIEEAKAAYIDLFASDGPRADLLMNAMQAWVVRRQEDPGEVGAEAVGRFATWVRKRLEIAGQTDSLSQLERRDW